MRVYAMCDEWAYAEWSGRGSHKSCVRNRGMRVGKRKGGERERREKGREREREREREKKSERERERERERESTCL